MSTIEPGTPVRVIIEGEVVLSDPVLTSVEAGGVRYRVGTHNSAVQVVPVDPERPTLDVDTLIATLLAAQYGSEAAMHLAAQGWAYGEAEAGAHAILALIEAAHPGLIR